jgi:hypothetical protein
MQFPLLWICYTCDRVFSSSSMLNERGYTCDIVYVQLYTLKERDRM